MDFTIGNALGTTFRVWFRNFIPFTILSAVIHLPIGIWLATMLHGSLTPGRVDDIQTYAHLSLAVGIVLNILLTSALVYGVVMELRGARARLGRSVLVGLARFLPALGVSLLLATIVFLGVLSWVIPGVMAYTIFYVAVPASVIERPGLWGAMNRSSQLTAGLGLKIFAMVVLVFAVNYGLTYGVERTFLDKAATGDVMPQLRLYAGVDLAREIVTSTFGAVLVAVTYFQLRQRKDGTSADELARVFD